MVRSHGERRTRELRGGGRRRRDLVGSTRDDVDQHQLQEGANSVFFFLTGRFSYRSLAIPYSTETPFSGYI